MCKDYQPTPFIKKTKKKFGPKHGCRSQFRGTMSVCMTHHSGQDGTGKWDETSFLSDSLEITGKTDVMTRFFSLSYVSRGNILFPKKQRRTHFFGHNQRISSFVSSCNCIVLNLRALSKSYAVSSVPRCVTAPFVIPLSVVQHVFGL